MQSNLSDPRDQRRRERRQQISSLQIVFVSILAIGLLLAINFSARIRRGQQIEDLRGQIEATINIELTANTALRQTESYVSSDESVARWAHSEGKMVRPGENLVIPVPGQISPTPTVFRPKPTAEIEEVDEDEEPTWELWWRLFFDQDAPDWLK